MINLYLHGTSMLYYVPVARKKIKWNTQEAWTSAAELANPQREFPCGNKAVDYLVVDLSYTVNCQVAVEGEKCYSMNNKNKELPQVKNPERVIDVKKMGLAGIKMQFDRYIEKVKKTYDKVILVRMTCPNRSVSRYFVQPYHYKDAEQFNVVIRELEDYFIQQVSPVEVDITRAYYLDVLNQQFGPCISYEKLFYSNMRDILEEIVLKKSTNKKFDLPNYKYILKRYLKYYDIACERNEQYLLLDKDTPLNRLVRSMNKELVQKFSLEITFLSKYHIQTEEELEEKLELLPALKKYYDMLNEIARNPQGGNYENVKQLLGSGLGVELEILSLTRAYYEEQGYLPQYYINLSNLKEFYCAMKWAREEDYSTAIDYVKQALQKLGMEQKKLSVKNADREKFAMALAIYADSCPMISFDVWGKFISNSLLPKQNIRYRVGNLVNQISCVMPKESRKVFERLQRSEAQWLLFDLYSILGADADLEHRSEEEIQEALDTFLDFIKVRYGENIIFHRLEIKTDYRNENQEMVSFLNVQKLEQDQEKLKKWQEYVENRIPMHVIDCCSMYDLTQNTFIVNDGINYGWDYFASARKMLVDIVSGSQQPVKLEHLVNAYVNMNLGDDLFLVELAKRYPQQQFVLPAKNKYVAKAFSSCPNIQVVTEFHHSYIKSCKNTILLGGSIFMERKYWRINYQKNLQLQKKSKKTFVLGANFGPYTTEEFLKVHKKFFEKCRDVCFRDRASYQLFSEQKRVRKAADIIFSLESLPKARGKGLVISVIYPKNRPDLADCEQNYYQALAGLASEAIKQNIPVCFVSFCDNEGDNLAIEGILELVSKEERKLIRTYSYHGEIQEALGVLLSAEYIVATRFHGTVLGLLMEKKVYPIIYSNKTRNMLQDVGFSGESCEMKELKSLTLKQVQANAQIHINLEEIAQKAREQYEKLDRLL